MTEATYPVTLMLSEETILLLADHGDEFLSALSHLVDEAKRSQPSVQKQSFIRTESQKIARAERIKKINRDGRIAHRRFRQLISECQTGLPPKERNSITRNAIAKISIENGWQPNYTKVVISSHKKPLLKKVKNRNELTVLRLITTGFQNKIIANQLGFSNSKIEKLSQSLRKRANEERISLFDLERRMTIEIYGSHAEVQS